LGDNPIGGGRATVNKPNNAKSLFSSKPGDYLVVLAV